MATDLISCSFALLVFCWSVCHVQHASKLATSPSLGRCGLAQRVVVCWSLSHVPHQNAHGAPVPWMDALFDSDEQVPAAALTLGCRTLPLRHLNIAQPSCCYMVCMMSQWPPPLLPAVQGGAALCALSSVCCPFLLPAAAGGADRGAGHGVRHGQEGDCELVDFFIFCLLIRVL